MKILKRRIFNWKKEKVQIDMRNLGLKGDIIDVGIKNYGIIYKICKHKEDEIAVEYLMDEEKVMISRECYDTAALFFTLSQVANIQKKKSLLREILTYIREDGEIVIWDLNKPFLTLINLEIEVLMPEDEVQYIYLRGLNPMKEITIEQVKKIVRPYFEIIEEKEGEIVFFLRARRKRKGKELDESSIGSA